MTMVKKKAPDVVHGIKGFDSNLQCRGFQFAIGETYTHEGKVRACRSGFHAIVSTAHPLSVFNYYPPAGSRFCRVEMTGATSTDDDIKIAAEILKVGKEIGITDLVNEAIAWTLDRATPEGETATGEQGAASATGYRGAASATGEQGAASATGEQGAASATGEQGAASATGEQGAAMTSGYLGIVSGKDGNALFSVERATWDGPIISVACGIVGQDGIKPDTWYRAENGKLIEVTQ
jgi:hypothetical protein